MGIWKVFFYYITISAKHKIPNTGKASLADILFQKLFSTKKSAKNDHFCPKPPETAKKSKICQKLPKTTRSGQNLPDQPKSAEKSKNDRFQHPRPGIQDPSQTPRKWSPRTKKRARKWSPRTPENGQKWRPQTTSQDPRKWLLTPIFQASDPEIWPGPGNLAKTTRFGQNHHFLAENAVFSTFPAQTPLFAKKWLSG